MEFIRSFQSEAPLKRGVVSAQDASLQERVLAQVNARSRRLWEAEKFSFSYLIPESTLQLEL